MGPSVRTQQKQLDESVQPIEFASYVSPLDVHASVGSLLLDTHFPTTGSDPLGTFFAHVLPALHLLLGGGGKIGGGTGDCEGCGGFGDGLGFGVVSVIQQ